MIKHSFKLIWNQKKKNSYIILELFLLFVVLFLSSAYLIEKYELYTGGIGADIEDTFYVRLVKKDYKQGDYKEQLMNMRKDLESLPTVKKVSYSRSSIPYNWSMSSNGMENDSINIGVVVREVDENYADILGIKMLAGHWLENDYQGARAPVVIDMQAAEKLFGSINNALNKEVRANGNKTVVGVYEMLKRGDYEENYISCVYPFNMTAVFDIGILVKYKKNELPNPAQLSKIIFSYFSKDEFVIIEASTMEAKKSAFNSEWLNEVILVSFMTVFLVVNIILGMIGIFGYSVKRRISELGLRRAVGSSAYKIHYLLLLESWTLTLFALIPAILLAIQIPLLDLHPIETALFIKALSLSIALIFILVSLSVYYPGYLASKIQASEALQEE